MNSATVKAVTPRMATSVGTRFGAAGEWGAYVATMTLAFERARVAGCVLLIAGMSIGGFIRYRGRGPAMLAPAALVAAAVWHGVVGGVSLAVIGLALGWGASAAGRSSAWLGVFGGRPTWAGVSGAGVAAIVGLTYGLPAAALTAAVCLVVGTLAGEDHSASQTGGPLVFSTSLGIAFAIGIRVLEPAFILGARSSIFYGVAWIIGADIGARISKDADPRAVLGMPFVFSASLAGFGQVEGPGSIFLYALTGTAAAMVLQSGARKASGTLRPGITWPQAAVLAAGILWAATIGSYDVPVTVWVMSGVVLVAGFAGLATARKLREPVASGQMAGDADFYAPLPSAVVATHEEEPSLSDQQVREAVELLLDATQRARTIRTEALQRFREAGSSPVSIFTALLDDLEQTANRMSGINLG